MFCNISKQWIRPLSVCPLEETSVINSYIPNIPSNTMLC